MSETKHTPEPWKIDEHENHFFIMRRWGGGVEPGNSSVFGSAYGAHIGSLEFVGDTAVPTRKQAEANARRIVACVNACKQYTNDELEYGMIEKEREAEMAWERAMMAAIGEDGPKSVSEAIAKLKTERDELLAALEAFRSSLLFEYNTEQAKRLTIAAIDKARGTA